MWSENPQEAGKDIDNMSMARWLFESALARLERTNKRLFVLLIIIATMFFASNVAWVIYENQFEDVRVEQEVDTGEGDAYVAGGDIYGSDKTNN